MTTSELRCVECETIREGGIWGFALMARHGWHAAEEFADSKPGWLCARCSELATRARELSDADTTEVKPVHPISVLLVDDEAPVARATCRVLRNFEVVPVTSAEEALKILASVRFDVVVSDVSMPGLSGPQLYEHACHRWPSLAERFVFMTGNVSSARPVLAAAARRVGKEMPSLIDKLDTREALPTAILQAARRSAARSGTYPVTRAARSLQRAAG